MFRALFTAFSFALLLPLPLYAQAPPGEEPEKPAAGSVAVQAAKEQAPSDVSRLTLEREDASRRVNHGMQGKPYKKMLPSGFKDVIDAQQREKVYKTQEEYHHAIQRLHSRIAALEKERDRAFMEVLTPEQSEKVDKFRTTPASLRPEPVRRAAKTAKKPSATSATEAPAAEEKDAE